MNTTDRYSLVNYRLQKAKQTFAEIEILRENCLWNTAVNRLYYACYYAVVALLVQSEINTQTHAGVRQMFGLHFVKTGKIPKALGKFFSDIYDMRQTGDYDDFIDFTEEDIADLIVPAQELITAIEMIVLR